MKIHITGNADSGKTTLALKLGEALNIPVSSLDDVVWKNGWVPNIREQRLMSSDCWIIGGVSKTVRESADYIVFLDVPRFVCIFRCFKRNFLYLFKSRTELPESCPEILIVHQLLKIIWNFLIIARHIILETLDRKKE
jgi:adenylate kinase family enzyme